MIWAICVYAVVGMLFAWLIDDRRDSPFRRQAKAVVYFVGWLPLTIVVLTKMAWRRA